MAIRTTLLLLFLCAVAQGGTYHATPSGAGSHSGANLANALSFTEAMYGSPGDTIWFRTGTYPYLFSPVNSGTAGLPVVYKAYPGETVTMTGAADGSPQVVVVPTDYIELHGAKVVTAENPSGNNSYMVDLMGDHIVFRNNEVTYSGNVVSDYNSSGYRTRGIVLAGAYVTVDSNYVRGMCEGIASSGGSPRYHVIRGNTVHASAWNGLLQLATTDGTTDYLGVLWEGNDVDTCYGEDCLQFQQNYDGAVNLNRNRGTVVRGNLFQHAGENLIDLKGAGRVVIEGNVMFTADGDDDGAFSGDQPWSGPGIERGNPAQGVEDRYTTVRGNVVGDASSGRTMATVGSQDANNLYINNRRRLNVSNTSDSTYELKGILVEGNDDKPRMILNDLFIGQPNWVNLYLYYMDNRGERFDLDHNLYYDSVAVERFYHWKSTSGSGTKVYGLAAWKTALSHGDYSYITGREQHSLNSNPLFASMPLRAYGYNPSWDWSLSAGSPAIGSARCWAFTTASGTGTTIPVTNAYIWSDGFGIVQGDSVKIGSNAATYITASNPASATITVAASQTYSIGDSVYFVVNGAVLRNLGPYNVASVAGGGDPGAPPDAPANVAPANGTSTTSPVTFRWTTEAGATSYWLCVSPDGWGTLIVNQSSLTDTTYTVALPQGGSYVWNVSASNAYGRSDWSSDWTFTTNVVSTYRDTVTLSWNDIKHSRTLDTNTVFQFSHLQRRDIQVALRNPNGKEVSWLGVTWITAQPPIIPPAQSWYQFFWDGGDSVLGSYINNSSIATFAWGSIVGNVSDNAALTTALRAKADAAVLDRYVSGESAPLVTGSNVGTLGAIGRFSGASSTTLWYGHLAKDTDGSIYYGYVYDGSQGRTMKTTDNGKTWQSFVTQFTVGTNHTTGGCSFGITKSGTWVYLYSEDTAGSPYSKQLALKAIRSTNKGASWSSPATIPTTKPFGVTSGIMEFSDGTLMAAYAEGFYGYRGALVSLYGTPAGWDTTKIMVVKSTDGGASWGTPKTAYAHHDSVYQLNEPFLDEPGGAVDVHDNAVLICRTPDYGTGQLVSTDQGETWTYSGIIGQTNCGPGVYSNNSSPDLLMVNDSTFMAIVGYRLNMDGPGTDAGKVGYMHILTGTWREIQDAAFGWSTFIPPTYVEYGDAGAHRGVISHDTTLVLVQLQGGRTYRMTPAEVTKARANWVLSSKESMQFRPSQTYNFPERLLVSNSSYGTLYTFNIMTPPQYDSITSAAVGAIPVVYVSINAEDAAGADTLWVKLTDANDITMPAQGSDSLLYVITGGTDYVSDFPAKMWFPTKLRNAGGTSVLGQFEKQIAPVHIKAKAVQSPVLNSIELHFGYVYK